MKCKIQKNWEKLIYTFVFSFSVMAFTALEVTKVDWSKIFPMNIVIISNLILSLGIAFWFSWKYNWIEKCFSVRSGVSALIAELISIFALYKICALMFDLGEIESFFWQIGLDYTAYTGRQIMSWTVMVALAAKFSVFTGIYYVASRFKSQLLPKIKEWIGGISKLERVLLILAATAFTVVISVTYGITDAFDGTVTNYDVIFSTDSGNFIRMDVFYNFAHWENDLRNMLFGAAAMPFALVAKLLAAALFIPKHYITIMQIIQVLLMLVAGLMIAQMLAPEDAKVRIIAFLGYICSYSFLLFSFIVEQYIFATFFIVLTVYLYCFKKKEAYIPAVFATGTMITSGVILPLVIYKKDWRDWFKSCLKIGFLYVAVCIICGKLITLVSGFQNAFNLVTRFGGASLTFLEKFQQYSNFVFSVFLKPATMIVDRGKWYSYLLQEVSTLNIIGLVLLALAILGFALNHKKAVAKFSFFWIVLSFFVLVIIGWGTYENGLILYALYFGWAFYVLVFLFFDKVFDKVPRVKNGVFLSLLVLMQIYNLFGIKDILSFALWYT